jgi:hypothetical protein
MIKEIVEILAVQQVQAASRAAFASQPVEQVIEITRCPDAHCSGVAPQLHRRPSRKRRRLASPTQRHNRTIVEGDVE